MRTEIGYIEGFGQMDIYIYQLTYQNFSLVFIIFNFQIQLFNDSDLKLPLRLRDDTRCNIKILLILQPQLTSKK